MAYRLMKNSEGGGQRSEIETPFSADSEESEDLDNEDDIEVMEELEDKQLTNRLENLEQENRTLREQIGKLEHGRSWLEERLDALEMTLGKNSFSIGMDESVNTSSKTVI